MRPAPTLLRLARIAELCRRHNHARWAFNISHRILGGLA